MTTHTPAPWETALATLVLDSEGNILCRVNPDRPEHEANRALIAAAPEMLAALQRAESAMSELLAAAALAPHSVRQGIAFNRGESATDSALAEVRSVIAKAQQPTP